jgi:hypothetical protein
LPAWDTNGEDIALGHSFNIMVSAPPHHGVLQSAMLDRLRNYGFVVGPQCNLVVPRLATKTRTVLDPTAVPKADLLKVAKAHYNAQLVTWRPQEEARRRMRAEAKAERNEKMQYCSRCSCGGCAAKRQKL